jgi:hypothetical protein
MPSGLVTCSGEDLASDQTSTLTKAILMLRLMALGEAEIRAGRTAPQSDVFSALRKKLRRK